jgi:hypothetical protein
MDVLQRDNLFFLQSPQEYQSLFSMKRSVLRTLKKLNKATAAAARIAMPQASHSGSPLVPVFCAAASNACTELMLFLKVDKT